MGPVRLRHELDRHLWKSADHLGLKQLWTYLSSYLYLPRLRDQDVLVGAVQEGIAQIVASDDTFAYAEGRDDVKDRYRGLKVSGGGKVVLDGQAMVVKPEAARAQLDREASKTPTGESACVTAGTPAQPRAPGDRVGAPPPLPGRFHASVVLNPDRVGRDAGKIAEEVIQHLSTLPGATLTVTLEIEAEIPEGVPEGSQRTVSENCKTLRVKSHGFEFA